jgi:hyperosmotically inducible protein
LSKAGSEVSDAWILSEIKTRFVEEGLLKGSDINVDCDKRVVTLRGTVASAAGRNRAMEIAESTKGVARVVDNLKIGSKN